MTCSWSLELACGLSLGSHLLTFRTWPLLHGEWINAPIKALDSWDRRTCPCLVMVTRCSQVLPEKQAIYLSLKTFLAASDKRHSPPGLHKDLATGPVLCLCLLLPVSSISAYNVDCASSLSPSLGQPSLYLSPVLILGLALM